MVALNEKLYHNGTTTRSNNWRGTESTESEKSVDAFVPLGLSGETGSIGSGGDSRCVGISAGNVAHAGCLNNVGLDQFGRVANQNWVNSSGSTVDGYTYTYDSNGNVLSKNNVLDSAYSETYTYDSLNRLTAVSRGGAICGSCPATGQLGRQPVGGHASAFAGGRGRPRGGA